MARKPAARKALIAVLLVFVAGIGCNPFLAPFQMFGLFNDAKGPCHFNFYDRAVKEKRKKDIRIVVIPYMSPSVPFRGVENAIASTFIRKLDETFKVNKDRVTIVSPSEFEKFRRTHEDWKGMQLSEIGKNFSADYVVELEVTNLSLYEPLTRDIFRGNCRISVRITDVDHDGETFDHYDYSTEYPGNGQSVPMDMETTVERFKQRFVAKIALDLTGLFTPLPAGADRFQ